MKMRLRFALIVLACSTLISVEPALAQFVQQGPKLVGTGYVGQPAQGESVAISADGNTAIVGGDEGSDGGAAWFWTRSGGVWTQQGPKLAGSSGNLGFTVSLSADGNTALVAAPTDGLLGTGAVLIWTRTGGVWTQQGPKLVGSGYVGSPFQGFSAALSADGNTAIVGGPEDNANVGAVWVWTRSGGIWTQQGSKLIGSGAAGNALQGISVSLSADGNTALVGGRGDGGGGAAWVWTRNAGVWTQQGNKLVGSGAVGFANQGTSVALSADGNTAIIGGYSDNSDVGAAWIWTRSAGVWTQQGNKLVGSFAFGKGEQGSSVSISADGNLAIVAGPTDNSGDGSLWVWIRSGGVWTQQGHKLQSIEFDGQEMGIGLSLSGDGKTIIAGGPFDNQLIGAAWIFTVSADLSISKSLAGGPPVPAGQSLNYTISVANHGPSTASSVAMTDVLPAGTTFVSAMPSQGSCSGTSTVSCALGTLANGGGATINLVVKAPSTPGAVSNTATVSATEADPNPANNSSTSTITTVDPASIPAASAWVLVALIGMLALLGATKMKG
jgi:uncharacterized repeat protein (TIGR01451 family)